MSDIDLSQLPPGIDPQDIKPPNYNNCDDVSVLCPVSATVYGDYFNLGACIFFVAAHSVLLLAQTYLGIRSRAWSYAGYLAIGTIFELMGYAARIALSQNPWIYDAFVIQLVMLILGPTLVAAAISVTFKHLVLWYGREWSFIKPVLYPWVFVGTDFFSIIIQAVGGIVSAIATGGEEANDDLLDSGNALLIAGVVFQMVNMIFCGSLMLFYLWNRRRGLKKRGDRNQTSQGDTTAATGEKPVGTSDKKTKIFLWAISAAYMVIIIRCVYRYVVTRRPLLPIRKRGVRWTDPLSNRIPEQQRGWGNSLMQNETLFLILDGAMILIAVGLLTIFHPNFYFPFLSKKKDKKASAGLPPAENTLGVDGPEMSSAPDSRHGA